MIFRLDIDKKVLYLGNGQSFHLDEGPREVQEVKVESEEAPETDKVGDIIALDHDGINATFFGDDRFIYQLIHGKKVRKEKEKSALSFCVQKVTARECSEREREETR